ncbi:MAG: DUF3822 family protein [Chitinophagaceae bacterium]
MKVLFRIGEGKKIINGSTLLCEWGNNHCCFSAYDWKAKTLQNLQYAAFDYLTDNVGDDILQEIKKETEYDKVLFCSCFSQAILTPAKTHQQADSLLTYVFDEKNIISLRDVIPELQLVNHYYFPNRLYKKILSAIPLACFLHMYTPSIKIYNGYAGENQVAVHFTPYNFRIIVKKNGQLQLAQMYSYRCPLDVVYYLLKIIDEFGLLNEDTYIILSGLIEEDSALYKELHQYFLNVHFALPGNILLQNNNMPQHFFTSMYNLAACA